MTLMPPPAVATQQPKPLTPAWYPLRPHAMQSRLYYTRERNVVVCAGRGSGKTEISRRKIVRYLRVKKPWSDPKYFYALPTYGQCRRVAREQILSLIPRAWHVKVPGDSAMEFKTVFGSWLFLVGMDVPARIEGDQYDGGVVDESSDQKPGVYGRTLRPALTHRQGWLHRIGVPKRFGVGAGEFKRAFEDGVLGESSFTWPSWDILPQSEIDEIKKELDEKDFREQIGGNWEDAGGAAYYAFSPFIHPDGNVSDRAEYNPRKMIYCSMDFNVDPMAWVLCHRDTDSGELHVFDELWLRSTNTEWTLDELHKRYGEHKAGWTFTGDASSQNRHTSSTVTDRARLGNDKRFRARIRFDSSNPNVKDRVAAVNKLCKNAAKERKLLVNPRCQHLIADLRNRALDVWGAPAPATPGMAHDSGHATDALGYIVWRYYPLKRFEDGAKLIVVGGASG